MEVIFGIEIGVTFALVIGYLVSVITGSLERPID